MNFLPNVIGTVPLVCHSLASDHFIPRLDVCQLVFQCLSIAAFEHMGGLCKSQLRNTVLEKSLGVEDAKVSKDLVVQSDSVFCSVNLSQLVFLVDAGGFLVP